MPQIASDRYRMDEYEDALCPRLSVEDGAGGARHSGVTAP